MKKVLMTALPLLLLFGCGGEENPALPDAAVTPDAPLPPPPPPPPQNVTVSGQVAKLGSYLSGNTEYSGGVSVLAFGVSPLQSTLSAEAGTVGSYSLTIPANGQVIFYANKLGYYPTYTPVTAQQADIGDKKLYITEVAWLEAIATAHAIDLNTPFTCHGPPDGGLDPANQCIYGVIVGRILDDASAPVAGISAADFTITGGANGANWYVKGPYFLNPDGTPNAAATESLTVDNGAGYEGGLYVTFVELPQLVGPEVTNIQLNVVYTDPDTGVDRQFGPQSVQVYRGPNGVTWSTIYESGVAPPPPVGAIDFDTQVYPLFLPVNQGGFGCQGCHTDQGGATPAGGMNLYGGPDVAYASLDPNNYPQRVNVAAPANSYLLTKPLYEDVGNQNHPIFAFASVQDPGYKILYQWISEGGLRDGGVLPPISFRNDIRPLLYQPVANGGAGCYSCHVSGVDANTAPGGFYMGGTPEELYAELTAEAPTDNGGTGEPYRVNKNGDAAASLLLLNPLYGNPEPHPTKLFQSNLDPVYQRLYRWVQEGYVDDGQ